MYSYLDALRKYWHLNDYLITDIVNTPLDLLYAWRGRKVKTLLLFVGYSRSGSTLLEQILNSHPESVIAHEAFILRRLRSLRIFPTFFRNGRIVRMIMQRDHKFRKDRRYRNAAYSYALNLPWQGKCSFPVLIGDKGIADIWHTFATSEMSPTKQLNLPVKFLFTIRNPYDCIASRSLGRILNVARGHISLRNYTPKSFEKIPISREDVDWFVNLSRKLSNVLPLLQKEGVYQIRYENFISSPAEHLLEICRFLGLEPNEKWLDTAACFTLRTPHQPRWKSHWTHSQISEVSAVIKESPWLTGYNQDA